MRPGGTSFGGVRRHGWGGVRSRLRVGAAIASFLSTRTYQQRVYLAASASLRRHLTTPQKVKLAAAHVAFKRQDAKERQRAEGKRQGGDRKSAGAKNRLRVEKNEVDKEPPKPEHRRAVQEAAETQGISEDTLRKGIAIQEV